MNKFMSLLLVSTISITSAFATQNHKHLTMEEVKAMKNLTMEEVKAIPLNELKSNVLDIIEFNKFNKNTSRIKKNYESIKKCVTEATSKVALKECLQNNASHKNDRKNKKCFLY